jgi:hypothetical protein
MTKALHLVLLLSAIAALCLGIYGAWGLNRHLIVALDKWGDGGQAEFIELHRTLQELNAPCVGFHGSVSCGPLAQLSQTEKDIGIVAAQSALQVKQTGALVTAAAQSVQRASADIHSLTVSASGTMNEATTTLGTANESLRELQPLETNLAATAAASTVTINGLNGRIGDPRVDALLTDFRKMADSGADIAADGKTVADYGTKQITGKKSFLQRVEGYSGDLFDITAYLARHYR